MTLKAYEKKEYACLVVLYEGYIEIELNHPCLNWDEVWISVVSIVWPGGLSRPMHEMGDPL